MTIKLVNGIPTFQAAFDAFATSDNTGTYNCSLSTVSNKTRITLSGFTYETGKNSGSTRGDLRVVIDGQEIPRFKSGVTVDSFYTEVSSTVIDLDADYSDVQVSIHIQKN